jgi:hypothetical protein
MEPANTQKSGTGQSAPYQSRLDNRPLTDREKTLWWVMGAMGIFSMLLLFILMALFHTPLAAN